MSALPVLPPFFEALRAAWSWWRAELSASPPRWLQRRLTPPVLVLQPHGTGWTPLLCEAGRSSPWRGQAAIPLDPDGRPKAELQLDPRRVLRHRIELPRMPPADLARATALELERHIPCDPSLVRVATAVQRAVEDPGSLSVSIAMARIDALAEARAQAEAAGFGVCRIVVRGEPGLVLDQEGAGSARLRDAPWLRWTVLCGLLVAVNLVLLDARREAERAELDAMLAESRVRAEPAIRLRAALHRDAALLERKPAPDGAVPLLAVLADLTRLLPDPVFLDSLELAPSGGRVTGHAPDPVALVALLERSGRFTEARLRSASGGGPGERQRFELGFALRPATRDTATGTAAREADPDASRTASAPTP